MTDTPERLQVQGEVRAWPDTMAEQVPDGPWMLIHVKPRQDLRLAEQLAATRVPHLCFLERRTRRYRRQGLQIGHVPLFPGYLFVHGDDYDPIYATRRAVQAVTLGEEAPLLAEELRSLCTMLIRLPGPVVVRPELQVGTKVTITAGALAGCRGIITRRHGTCDLVVNLDILGHSVATRLPADYADLAQD